MITSLNEVKNYLRVDIDDDDELLTELLATAEGYLKGAVSNFEDYYSAYEEFAKKADLLQMVLVAEFYQNRDNESKTFSYAVNSLIRQLQYFAIENVEVGIT